MKRSAFLGLGALAATAVAAFAGDIAPSNVVFDDYGAVEISLTGVAGDPASGMSIMTNRGQGNCVACHQVTELTAAFQGNVGPSLDGAGDRWTEAELRGIVANAKMIFDGTIMPAFFKNEGFIRPGDAFTGKAGTDLAPLLSAQAVEDVVAYLMTLTE
ncbi:MAG: sulfur oxidation c-type cytochrome SoxX [Paracoccaceae bacterium]